MKAKIRHVISPPLESPRGLRDRIVNSISPIIDDTLDNDDTLSTFDSTSTVSSSTFASFGKSSAIIGGGGGGGFGSSIISNNNNSHSTSSQGNTNSSSNHTSTDKLTNVYNQRIISQVNKFCFETRISVLEIHPCKPLICYVDTNGNLDDFNMNKSTNASANSLLTQRIVLQNHISNRTIAIISIIDVIKQYLAQVNIDMTNRSNGNGYNNSNSSSDSNNTIMKQIQKTCRNFGLITSIQFMDLHILQQQSGLRPNTDHKHPPPYLIIHFESHILLYPIGYYDATATTSATMDNHQNQNDTHFSSKDWNNEIIEISTNKTLNKANISSKYVVPIISSNLLAIGCSDGAMRFYSIVDQKVVKSVRGPNGKSDPVVGILSLNEWDWSSFATYDDDYYNTLSLDDVDESDDDILKSSSNDGSSSTYLTWIMTICASGTAYIWELQVGFHKSTGQVKKFNIRPPLVKLDCFSYFSSVVGSSSNNSIMSPSSLMNNHNNIVQRSVDGVKYDMNRQMLFWTVLPSQHNIGQSSKTYVVAWDVSRNKVLLTQKAQRHGVTSSESAQHTPLHYPQGIMYIPTNSDMMEECSNHRMISGLVHPTFPSSSYTCLVASENGSLNLICASYQRSEGNKSLSRKAENGSIYNHFHISVLKRTSDEKVLGNLRFIEDSKLKVFKIVSSPSRPDIVVMSTNGGFVVVTLNEEDILVTGSIHTCFSSAKANSSGFIGAGGNILLVQDSSVLKARIDFTPTSKVPNPIGTLGYQDMILFYRSPPPLQKSADFQARPVRIPPRMLPSPSGNFLCLFWHSENRYEIIHNSSITNASRKSTRDNGPAYSPAVDSGCNVLSFAWVGEEDIFALLYPPELGKSGSGSYETKVKVRTLALDEEDDDEDVPIDPSKLKPRVELKVLVGVNKDAVALNSSVAAATATFLGTLSLRGRHSPTCLFGGPVLCVASLSQDKELSRMDGMAYFYCRRANSEENDNRASSFTSMGPALPYPDLVVWDDDGKICAVIVGRRVAIYLADPPNFTLLCTAHLGKTNESDENVHSAKFVHGVLFLSTQTSIQCVFLGDTENDDIVCEADSFILISTDASFNRIQHSIKPQAHPMTLICPSILGYFNGSLLVSTVCGIHAISLAHPLIRIGALLTSGHFTRAQRWFHSIPKRDHEALANFLERRGFPEMAVELSGLSLETIVQLSISYGLTDNLINTIELQGLERLRSIDDGKPMLDNFYQSTIVCICSYLLCEGKDDLVLHIANECLSFGEQGRREAFALGMLLIGINPVEARYLIIRATSEMSTNSNPLSDCWPIAKHVYDEISSD